MALLSVLVVWEGLGPRLVGRPPVSRARPRRRSAAAEADLRLVAERGGGHRLRLYFVTGEIWPHLATSGLELAAGLVRCCDLVGVPRASSRPLPAALARDRALRVRASTPRRRSRSCRWSCCGSAPAIATRVLIIFLLTVLPIMINAHAAVRTIDPRLMTVARSFAASEALDLLQHHPADRRCRSCSAGLRLAIGRGMIGIVVGELYGSARRRRHHDEPRRLDVPDRRGVRRRAHHRGGRARAHRTRPPHRAAVDIWRAPSVEPSS